MGSVASIEDWFLKTGPILADLRPLPCVNSHIRQIFFKVCKLFLSPPLLIKYLLRGNHKTRVKTHRLWLGCSDACTPGGLVWCGVGGKLDTHTMQCKTSRRTGERIKSSVSPSSLSLDFCHGEVAGGQNFSFQLCLTCDLTRFSACWRPWWWPRRAAWWRRGTCTPPLNMDTLIFSLATLESTMYVWYHTAKDALVQLLDGKMK